eukprot:GGOE01002423.1.p2 GENE.GGOE01002423.1~~GGOE01002423.1.p2  ORF type:complete len:293 (+),score=103.57 GGOE01002423.1:63-941(+)
MKRGYFLGRLNPGTTSAMLRSALRAYGEVLSVTIPYHKNGQLRQYAFLQMQHTDKSQSERLLKSQVEVNGTAPRIQLQLAQSHDDPDHLASVKKAHVSGFPDETDEATLWQLFSQFGKVKETVIVRSKDTGLSRGFGFVTFETSQSCRAACSTSIQFRGGTVTCTPKITQRVRSLRKDVEWEVKKALGKPLPSKEELQKERNAKRKMTRQKRREWLNSLGGVRPPRADRLKATEEADQPPAEDDQQPKEDEARAKQKRKEDRSEAAATVEEKETVVEEGGARKKRKRRPSLE